MTTEKREKFQFEDHAPATETDLEQAFNTLFDIYDKATHHQPFDTDQLVSSIYRIDQMGRATQIKKARQNFMIIGEEDAIAHAVKTYIINYDNGGFSREVLVGLRVSHILGLTQPPRRPLLDALTSRFRSPSATSQPSGIDYQILYNKHIEIIENQRTAEAKRQKAESEAVAKTKDREARLKEVAWRAPDPKEPKKSPEWSAIQKQARRTWNDLLGRGIITINATPAEEITRFRVLMDLLHVVIDSNRPTTGKYKACRAITEELYQDVWTTPEFMMDFFSDDIHTQHMPFPIKVSEISAIAQAFFVPSRLRGTDTPLPSIRTKISKFYRTLLTTYHPQNKPEENPDFSEYAFPFITELYKMLSICKSELDPQPLRQQSTTS